MRTMLLMKFLSWNVNGLGRAERDFWYKRFCSGFFFMLCFFRRLRWRVWIFFLLEVFRSRENNYWFCLLFLGVFTSILIIWDGGFVIKLDVIVGFLLFLFVWRSEEEGVGGFFQFMVFVILRSVFYFWWS